MKLTNITTILAISILMTACGKKAAAPVSASTVTTAPVASPVIVAWQQGDKPAAVKSFVEADWSSRPLFDPESPLSMTEDQFIALPRAEAEAKSAELLSRISELKQLAQAVVEAGRAAASKGDKPQARKYLEALTQFGTAIDGPQSTRLLQLMGQAFKKMAATELGKIGP